MVLYITSGRTGIFGRFLRSCFRRDLETLKYFEEALPPYRAIMYWADAQYVIQQMDVAYQRLMDPPANR